MLISINIFILILASASGIFESNPHDNVNVVPVKIRKLTNIIVLNKPPSAGCFSIKHFIVAIQTVLNKVKSRTKPKLTGLETDRQYDLTVRSLNAAFDEETSTDGFDTYLQRKHPNKVDKLKVAYRRTVEDFRKLFEIVTDYVIYKPKELDQLINVVNENVVAFNSNLDEADVETEMMELLVANNLMGLKKLVTDYCAISKDIKTNIYTIFDG